MDTHSYPPPQSAIPPRLRARVQNRDAQVRQVELEGAAAPGRHGGLGGLHDVDAREGIVDAVGVLGPRQDGQLGRGAGLDAAALEGHLDGHVGPLGRVVHRRLEDVPVRLVAPARDVVQRVEVGRRGERLGEDVGGEELL